jgi:hypothetical protein
MDSYYLKIKAIKIKIKNLNLIENKKHKYLLIYYIFS